MSQTWKTREETYHGSKWGYAVVALVIGIILFLIWTIFAALKGYPFIELLPPSTAAFFWILFLLYAIVTGTITVAGGKVVAYSFLANPFFISIVCVLGVATLFVLAGFPASILAVAAVVLLVIMVLLSLKGAMVLTANAFITAVLIVSVVVYISIIIMLGYSIPAINVIVALLAFFLLIIFFPFAIFLVDLFSYEHE